MAKDDLTKFDGQIVNTCAGGIYKVKLDNKNIEVLATLCGKMKRYNIQVVLGDRVTVGFSPYGLTTKGLIVYRYR